MHVHCANKQNLGERRGKQKQGIETASCYKKGTGTIVYCEMGFHGVINKKVIFEFFF